MTSEDQISLGRMTRSIEHLEAAADKNSTFQAACIERLARIEARLDGLAEVPKTVHANEIAEARRTASDRQEDESRAVSQSRWAMVIAVVSIGVSVLNRWWP